MKIGLLPLSLLLVTAVGCQRPQQCPPPTASYSPPMLTSSPVPPGEHPSPPNVSPRDLEHVYRLDFVLTPKDPKDPTLTPTTFTVNIPSQQSGEVMVGRNVPLQVTPPPAPPGGAAPALPHGTPRQDVGLKVKAHVKSYPGSDDLLLDVDLELSAVETGSAASAIRKVVARGATVATPGKPALIVSLDDDRKHYELTVTSTKIR